MPVQPWDGPPPLPLDTAMAPCRQAECAAGARLARVAPRRPASATPPAPCLAMRDPLGLGLAFRHLLSSVQFISRQRHRAHQQGAPFSTPQSHYARGTRDSRLQCKATEGRPLVLFDAWAYMREPSIGSCGCDVEILFHSRAPHIARLTATPLPTQCMPTPWAGTPSSHAKHTCACKARPPSSSAA